MIVSNKLLVVQIKTREQFQNVAFLSFFYQCISSPTVAEAVKYESSDSCGIIY